jgi:hypothetical protein
LFGDRKNWVQSKGILNVEGGGTSWKLEQLMGIPEAVKVMEKS